MLEVRLFSKSFSPALKLTQPRIHWVSWSFSLKVKRPERDVDRSPQSSAIPPGFLCGFMAWTETALTFHFRLKHFSKVITSVEHEGLELSCAHVS